MFKDKNHEYQLATISPIKGSPVKGNYFINQNTDFFN